MKDASNSLDDSELDEFEGDDILDAKMTIIVGLAARDGCVLVGDRLGVEWANLTKQENVQKLYPIGKNVAIGLAGNGETTKYYLSSCRYLNEMERFDPNRRIEQVANVLRKAFLGKTSAPGWWEEEEERIQHLGIGERWDKEPYLQTLVAGFDNGPVLSTFSQKAAFVPQDVSPARAIGVTHWANPLLQHLYPGDAKDHSIAQAIDVGVFCAYLTSKFSLSVGGGFDIAVVTSEFARLLEPIVVADAVRRAEKTFSEWVRVVLSSSPTLDPST